MLAKTDLLLYSYYRSSAAYRVRIALELKQLQWQQIPINLLNGEHQQAAFIQVNSQGLVPALETEQGTITQSLAMIEYLDETYPEVPLLPYTAIDRAQVRSIAYQIAMEIHPLNNPRVTQFLSAAIGASESDKLIWYQHWVASGFASLERRLSELGSDNGVCFGDSVTLADLCLIPQVYNALRFDCPMHDFPVISAIYDHCLQLPAFLAASPEAQPDAPA